MRKVGLFLLSLGIAVTTLAAPPEHDQATSATALPQTKTKEAWEWTVEERIAARTDLIQVSRRLANAHTNRVQANAASSKSGAHVTGNRFADVIDGKQNPELFLPTELFENFMTLGFIGDTWRDVYDPELEANGLPADLWERLAKIDAQFIDDLRYQNGLLTRGKGVTPAERGAINAQLAGFAATLCRDSADALAKARAEFGVAIDRFLYRVVARDRATFMEDPGDANLLRALEAGCR